MNKKYRNWTSFLLWKSRKSRKSRAFVHAYNRINLCVKIYGNNNTKMILLSMFLDILLIFRTNNEWEMTWNDAVTQKDSETYLHSDEQFFLLSLNDFPPTKIDQMHEYRRNFGLFLIIIIRTSRIYMSIEKVYYCE